MAILAAGGVLDVIADIEGVIDAGAQLFVEMAAGRGAAARDGEGVRARAAGRDIGAEGHGGAAHDVIPLGEEIGQGGFVELFDEDDIGVGFDAHIAGEEGREARGGRRGSGIGDADRHTR